MDTLELTHGSKHNDHTFICYPKGRESLLKYNGYTKDQKGLLLIKQSAKQNGKVLEKDS